MIPLRGLIEEMGMEIEWKDKTQEIILSKDIHTIRNLAFNYTISLQKLICGDNTFPKLAVIESSQNFQGCTKLVSNFDFSSSCFTSIGLQSFNSFEYQQEIQDLKDKIDQLATSLGANLVRDVDGTILTDIEGNTMEYATSVTNDENFEEDNS